MAIGRTFDAVIIGGGPAGATAAVRLAQAGWSVAVIEKCCYPRRKVCGEFLSATNLPVLQRLGAADAFLDLAGPPVTQVGLFAHSTVLTAKMPRPAIGADGFGRALGREHLDTLLLARAAEAGAHVWQPCSVVTLSKAVDGYACQIASKEERRTVEIRASLIIAAHGFWERGALPTQPRARSPCPADLLAFKAHFHNSSLARDLMPLFVFAGGYGGMAHTDHERLSVSFCIQRKWLKRCRQKFSGTSAAEAVLAHIQESCLGVRQALAGARREGDWLSAGPIRPGVRGCAREGVFCVGNAAGEAHPLIAEGISMAIQSAWLLCERLLAHPDGIRSGQALDSVANDYSQAWRAHFVPRIRAAAILAHWAVRPAAVRCALPLLSTVPWLLTLCAQWSGKTNEVLGLTGVSGCWPQENRSRTLGTA
jgi:flavin-dependent dehydrogenase